MDDDSAGTTSASTVECEALPVGPFDRVTIPIATEEDFDFDAKGRAIHQDFQSLVASDFTGEIVEVVGTNVDDNAAGIQVLSTGDLVVADRDASTLLLYDVRTKGSTALLSNVGMVNGLEVGSADRVYYSSGLMTDGFVGWIDPYTAEEGSVAERIDAPNGLALSPDERTLYVAGGTFEASWIVAFDATADGGWGGPRPILVAPEGELYATVEVDACGTIYTVGYVGGDVLRITPGSVAVETLHDFAERAWSSARFGNGVGGWARETLYLTNRKRIVGVDLGVPGRPHPSTR